MFGEKFPLVPTGDENMTKMSRFGFQRAVDSMAHACLHDKNSKINFEQKSRKMGKNLISFKQTLYFAFNVTNPLGLQDVS